MDILCYTEKGGDNMADPDKEFGRRLKQIREMYRLSRQELADKLGLAYSTIAKYESGERTPDPAIVRQIVQFFGVTSSHP